MAQPNVYLWFCFYLFIFFKFLVDLAKISTLLQDQNHIFHICHICHFGHIFQAGIFRQIPLENTGGGICHSTLVKNNLTRDLAAAHENWRQETFKLTSGCQSNCFPLTSAEVNLKVYCPCKTVKYLLTYKTKWKTILFYSNKILDPNPTQPVISTQWARNI